MVEQGNPQTAKPTDFTNVHQLPSWRQLNNDTPAYIETYLFRQWRELPAWRKLEMMEELNRTSRQLALIGLRQRFPNADSNELKCRLASLILEKGLAKKFMVQLISEHHAYD